MDNATTPSLVILLLQAPNAISAIGAYIMELLLPERILNEANDRGESGVPPSPSLKRDGDEDRSLELAGSDLLLGC